MSHKNSIVPIKSTLLPSNLLKTKTLSFFAAFQSNIAATYSKDKISEEIKLPKRRIPLAAVVGER
jgi:hypothetical protein